VQQVIFPIVIVYHTACLRLDRNSAFALDIKLVQNLLVRARLDGARKLQEPVAECAFAMVDVRDNAEVAKALNWDGSNSLFDFKGYLDCLRFASWRCSE
jgi:hypothetical protein